MNWFWIVYYLIWRSGWCWPQSLSIRASLNRFYWCTQWNYLKFEMSKEYRTLRGLPFSVWLVLTLFLHLKETNFWSDIVPWIFCVLNCLKNKMFRYKRKINPTMLHFQVQVILESYGIFIVMIIKMYCFVLMPEIRDVSILVVEIGLIQSTWHVNFPTSKILY